jgi:hypothetical protein
MKKPAFIISLLFVSLSLIAQDFSKLSEIELIKAEDYKPNEPLVLECADYILSQPYKTNELNKLTCVQFIMRWMEGTPDFTFNIGSDFVDFCVKDTELGSVYMASMAKAATDKGFEDKSSEGITSSARELFLDYCSVPENNVKKNKAIKKALKERSSTQP